MPFSEEDKIVIKHYRVDKEYSTRRLLQEFPDKGWSKGGLDKLIKKIDETGTVDRKPGSGRPRSVRTEEFIPPVNQRTISDPERPHTHASQRQIAQELGISKTSVHRIINQDLRLQAFKRIRGQKLSDPDREKRVVRSRKMLRSLTVVRLEKTFFSDEKIFTVDTPLNSQNDRVYAPVGERSNIAEDRLYAERGSFPRSQMVSVAVSKKGKTSLHFVDPGAKVNSEYYTDTLLAAMIPEMEALTGGDFIFQQDGARAHTSRHTLAYLDEKVPEYLEPEMWPPNSPDLNPVDYSIWGALSERVYAGIRIRDLEHLRQRLREAWETFPQEAINNAIDQFRTRLNKVIASEGGHIEHLL